MSFLASSLAWRESVGILIRCVWEGAAALRSLRLWWPLLPWTVVRAGGVLWLGTFPSPPLDRLLPLWVWIGGDDASHFPESSAVLPKLMARLDPGFEWLLAFAGLTWACAALPDWFSGRTIRWGAASRLAAQRLPIVFLALTPGLVVSWGLTLLSDVILWVPPVGGLVSHLAAFAGVAVRALMAYTIASVVIGRLGAWAAIRRSASYAAEHFLATLAVVAVGYAVQWPWRTSPEQTVGLFEVVPPEWVAPWLAFGAIPAMVAAAFVLAATTRLYLHGFGTEDAR